VFHHCGFLVTSSAALLLRISLLFTILAYFPMESLSFTPHITCSFSSEWVKEVEEEQLFSSVASVPEIILLF